MAKKEPPAGLDHREVVRRVLTEVSMERRKVQLELDDAAAKYYGRDAALVRQLQRSADALAEAEAAVKAHERYKESRPGTWDAEHRPLERARDEAQAAHDTLVEEARRDMSKLGKRKQALEARAADLRREWSIHEREARAAGVGVDAYWTPEKGPAAEGVEVA